MQLPGNQQFILKIEYVQRVEDDEIIVIQDDLRVKTPLAP